MGWLLNLPVVPSIGYCGSRYHHNQRPVSLDCTPRWLLIHFFRQLSYAIRSAGILLMSVGPLVLLYVPKVRRMCCSDIQFLDAQFQAIVKKIEPQADTSQARGVGEFVLCQTALTPP